ncbi:MAG TPA: acetyl-CoA carboxylase biotin carboxylase subunit, partial [Ruminococcaceae bacterium]|nr:acetyl-CoA carboxylase biotin carboxylase subunit [Oscillospiraceae bacterium]
MFNKILIANRGEIAARIIRACKEMGIQTVAVVSEADRDCLHAYLADEAVCVGPAPSIDSYLNIQNIISAAVIKGVDAIHPGFGFLSENTAFAEICERCNIKFIGPDVRSIRLLGDKAAAKKTMKQNGVPIIPGSDGEVANAEAAKELAAKIGFPLLIKASAGGGGRGIKLVESESELESAFETASREAMDYFGDGGVYMEKYLTETR